MQTKLIGKSMQNIIFRVNNNKNNPTNNAATFCQPSTQVTGNCQRTPDELEKPHAINSGMSVYFVYAVSTIYCIVSQTGLASFKLYWLPLQ